MSMDPEFGLDLDAIFQVIEEADVFVVRFSAIEQRLLVDSRLDDEGMPFIAMVPPARSAEERYRYLRQHRPDLPLPEQITVIRWPRAMVAMRDLGVWERIEQRFSAVAGDAAVQATARVFREGRRLERADVVAAIKGGEGYETIWEREPEDD
jgi:hypothetical protein